MAESSVIRESTEGDVLLDLIEMLERASDEGRLVGADGTTLESVTDHRSSRATVVLELSSGQTFEVRVREGRRAS